MDLATLEELAKGRAIDAIVVTHLFGFMHDSGWAREISDAAGIPLIEDCAQAHGARHAGHMAGSVGHVGCFSFYPTKNLGAFGDGGAVVTSDPQIAERLVRLRQYGWEEKYRVQTAGGRNSRLDEMQAAVLRVKLPHLERWNERRQAIAARYSTEIAHPRIVVPKGRGEEYVAHLYVVQCGDRDGLRDYLAGHGILCDIHYPIPDHLQPACSDAPRPELPVTERLAKECLTLPCFPELTDDEVERIIDRINAW
jgi:dTDP-4-amino-4,6-dideoxygalactose transaminase